MSDRHKLITPSDIAFTAVVAAFGVLLLFLARPSAAPVTGAEAVFRKDGEFLASLPLSKDTVYETTGDYRNVFEIRDGQVFVAYTDCPNKNCQQMGAISAPGAVIACAPNGVTVSVRGASEDVDALTG